MRQQMDLVSVNVGLPKSVQFKADSVRTGIFKQPVSGQVSLMQTNLEGDGQADLSAHGGLDKAVYAYPVEHYDYWRDVLQREIVEMGSFGENFTVRGMLETDICIGDVFRVGSAMVQVSQPRTPCFKLAIRLGHADLPRQFLQSMRSGFYLRVLCEGHISAGDVFTRCDQDPVPIKVHDMANLYHFDVENIAATRHALQNKAIAEEWRSVLQKRIHSSSRKGD